MTCDTYDVMLSCTPFCIVSPREKKKKRKENINNDLVVLPSHDRFDQGMECGVGVELA